MPLGGGLVAGAAAGQAVLGLAKAGFGFFDEKKAKQEEDALKTPFYKIQDEYLQNRDIAAQEAQTGLSSSAKNYLTKETGRGLSAGISADLQAGGDPNQINKLLDTYTQSIGKLAVEDTALHTQKIGQFLEKNAEVAGQKNVQFAINELQPYQAKLKQLQERRAADKQNIFGGFSDALGGISALGTSMSGEVPSGNSSYTGKSLFTSSYQEPTVSTPINTGYTGGIYEHQDATAVAQPTAQMADFSKPLQSGQVPSSDASYNFDWSKVNWLAQ